MIDLPVGKAIIAVPCEFECNEECRNEDFHCPIDCCKGCDVNDKALEGLLGIDVCGSLCCVPGNRNDGKNVIYKLVDFLHS